MSEKRRKCATVLLRFPGKKSVKLELFPCGQWPGQAEMVSGSYRVRQDLAWVSLEGGKYEFLSPEAVGLYVAGLAFGEAQAVAPRQLRRGTRVRVTWRRATPTPCGDMDLGEGMRMEMSPVLTSELSWTCSPSYQGIDGQWRGCVQCCDEPVLLSQVEEVP